MPMDIWGGEEAHSHMRPAFAQTDQVVLLCSGNDLDTMTPTIGVKNYDALIHDRKMNAPSATINLINTPQRGKTWALQRQTNLAKSERNMFNIQNESFPQRSVKMWNCLREHVSAVFIQNRSDTHWSRASNDYNAPMVQLLQTTEIWS